MSDPRSSDGWIEERPVADQFAGGTPSPKPLEYAQKPSAQQMVAEAFEAIGIVISLVSEQNIAALLPSDREVSQVPVAHYKDEMLRLAADKLSIFQSASAISMVNPRDTQRVIRELQNLYSRAVRYDGNEFRLRSITR